jgi:hypothetical protein
MRWLRSPRALALIVAVCIAIPIFALAAGWLNGALAIRTLVSVLREVFDALFG